MQYASTRGAGPVQFSEALVNGLAPDGGLYMPVQWPALAAAQLPTGAPLPGIAAAMLQDFFAGDRLAAALPAITAGAFSFPAPLVALKPGGPDFVLELFHGPTAAFKDFGARFLAACMARLRAEAARPLQILVATSGDTGGAVAAAFHKRPGIRVTVLFPKGLVSPTQERQLTCWGDNVTSLAVRGTFDDCQRLVKQAFADKALTEKFEISSANSINIGRLLPQMTYFAAASLEIWRTHGVKANFVIPSGNLGHSTACVWARRIGLPIGEIVLAHNANRTMPDYLDSGEWRPRNSVATLASAMDVGDPSNAERLRAMYPDVEGLRAAITAYSVDDDSIRAGIRDGWARFGQMWCPHTAAAAQVYARHVQARRGDGKWVIAATAHAAKFREIVEPLIGAAVPIPQQLAELFARPSQSTEIDATLEALRAAL